MPDDVVAFNYSGGVRIGTVRSVKWIKGTQRFAKFKITIEHRNPDGTHKGWESTVKNPDGIVVLT